MCSLPAAGSPSEPVLSDFHSRRCSRAAAPGGSDPLSEWRGVLIFLWRQTVGLELKMKFPGEPELVFASRYFRSLYRDRKKTNKKCRSVD